MNKARGLISTGITPPEVRWGGFDRRNVFLDLLRIEASLFLFLVLLRIQINLMFSSFVLKTCGFKKTFNYADYFILGIHCGLSGCFTYVSFISLKPHTLLQTYGNVLA